MVAEGWDPFRARLTFEEADRSCRVRADLRGLAVRELQARVEGDTVTISGACSADGELRPFCRTLRLPAAVRGDRTEALYERGILTLTMPEAGALRPDWAGGPPPVRRPRSGGRTVLVVDDDEGNREVIRGALADEGYEVLTAPHGIAALDVVSRAQPEVIVLDVRMPVMDGSEFARAYRRIPGRHAPIIAVTAARDAAERAVEIGAEEHLAKPFQLGQLLATVGQYAAPN